MQISEIQLAVILPAAGLGSRLPGTSKKQFRKILDRDLFLWTLDTVLKLHKLLEIIIVASEEDISYFSQKIKEEYPGKLSLFKFCIGGASRQESVYCGLKNLSNNVNIVAIHDIVRPFVGVDEFNDTVITACQFGASLLGFPVKDTVKLVKHEEVESTIPREHIYLAQTPQAFLKDLIVGFHDKASKIKKEFTDDSMIAEYFGQVIKVVKGKADNIKITTAEDLILGEAILKSKLD